MLSIWLVSITCVTWLVDVELLVGVTWGHLQCQGQNNVPWGMPGTQTVGGTHSCSGGDIPPSSLLIRALQYTVNTTITFNAAVQDDAAAFSRSDYCNHGRSRFRLRGVRSNPSNPHGYGHAIFVLACFQGRRMS